jgi:hypothetical protein
VMCFFKTILRFEGSMKVTSGSTHIQHTYGQHTICYICKQNISPILKHWILKEALHELLKSWYELQDVQYLHNKCMSAHKPKITWLMCGGVLWQEVFALERLNGLYAICHPYRTHCCSSIQHLLLFCFFSFGPHNSLNN